MVYCSLDWGSVVEASMAAVPTTAMVLLVIGTASAFAWLLALNQVPAQLYALLSTLSDKPIAIPLQPGSFVDMSPLIAITTPIFLPVVQQLEMDPVQFRIVLMINPGLGLVTPPVGSVLLVGCAVAEIPVEQPRTRSGPSIWRSSWPWSRRPRCRRSR